MWISLLALLVATAHVETPQSAQVKTSKSRPLVRKASAATGSAFEALPEPVLREALLAMGEPVTLGAKEAKAVEAVVTKLRAGDEAGARKAWTKALKLRTAKGKASDVAALIGMVLRQAYLENTEDLKDYAEKVAFYNEAKKALRDELKAARELVRVAKDKGIGQVTVPTVLVRTEFKAGRRAVLARKQSTMSLGQAEVMIDKWEQQLSSIGDDAQLANIDLQNALQKQQQTLQTMSNVSKMLHDTAMSILCKISGAC